MSRGRRFRVVTATIIAVSCSQFAGVQSALADASSHASCIGIESSAIAPPGSTDEFPGGRAEAAAFVRDLARELGITPGAIISSVARIHAGSHEACDEATE
jgi:hypothetical protein